MEESSGIDAAISKSESALSIFLAVLVASVVACAIGPRLDTLSVLLVLEPVANVSCTIGVSVGAMAMSLVIEPHAFVNVTIGVHEHTLAISLIVLPLALISRRVGPHLNAVTMLLSIFALASVRRAIGLSRRAHIGDLVIVLVPACLKLGIHLVHLALRNWCTVLNCKLLPLLIDVGDIILSVLALSVLLLDCDFALAVRVLRHAVTCAVAHLAKKA